MQGKRPLLPAVWGVGSQQGEQPRGRLQKVEEGRWARGEVQRAGQSLRVVARALLAGQLQMPRLRR